MGPSFPLFMYDTLLMTYGLPNISVKIIFQICNGLLAT